VPRSPHTHPTNLLQINKKIQKLKRGLRDEDEKERWELQEAVIGTKGEEVMELFDKSALKNRPLSTEEGDQHQQSD